MKDNKNLDQVMELLQNGVKDVFTSEKYLNYLTMLSKFHNYSYNNVLLISLQNPNATLVAGYNDWVKKHHRYVKKGEKGIKIIAPSPYKKEVSVPVLDNNGNKVIVDGKPLMEQKTIQAMSFRTVSVFDVSQTDGEPLPQLLSELTDNVKNYNELFEAIKAYSEYPINFEDISGDIKGYCSYKDKRIAIKNGMSESQTIKTAIHETAHSHLHEPNPNDPIRDSRNIKEVQAESVAFVVSNYFGIDTSEYSFNYIAAWGNLELNELKNSLSVIQKEAAAMINGIEEKYQELLKSREAELKIANEQEVGYDKDADGLDDSRDSSYTASIESSEQTLYDQPKYSKEENMRIIDDLKRSIPIQDYAQTLGFTVMSVGRYFTLKEHDSVRIDPDKNRFVQNSTGVKGSIIDFVMQFENTDKTTAIRRLLDYSGIHSELTNSRSNVNHKINRNDQTKNKKLSLPERAAHMKNVFAYLINTRKIDSKVVSSWVNNHNLYQDTHNNCVFVTYDKSGKPEFASQRGTNTSKTFKADISGSNYDTCHFINNNAKSLIITESVIDCMSVQTILQAHGRDLNNYNYLSLNGTTKVNALHNALSQSETSSVIIAVDNDSAGRVALDNIKSIVANTDKDIKVIEYLPKNEKDWNAELVANVEKEKNALNNDKSSLKDQIINCTHRADELNQNIIDKKIQKSMERSV